MQLQPTYIAGMAAGLTKNKKPFLLQDQAWSTLENAYCWRERIKKKEGNKLIGRLSRILTAQVLGNADGAGAFTGNIVSILGLEATAEIKEGSVTVTAGANTLTEPATPDGTLTGAPAGTGTINYATGALTLAGVGAGAAVTITFTYYPSLPVMGIWQREQATSNNEETIFFDTIYAYRWSNVSSGFVEFIPGTIWSGTDADFFWATNYRGSTPQSRLFFVTNFVVNASNPIRYTDGTTWTAFNPLVDSLNNLYQARIIIPYYGRLLALNVYEGTTAGGYAGAVQIGNRCRFSQIGDPTAVDAWRSDQFGKGGFIDAPTSEQIISACFYKNTLIVGFERSTWQLRYVGEYGLPFIWERISTDFGTESTFSALIFDQGVLSIGDRAIVSSSGITVERIDLDIPDQVFEIANVQSGPQRVWGLRNFDKEVVYWCYTNTFNQEAGSFTRKFPNRVIVYNYRNNTWAIFRDNVTAFGVFQLPSALVVTWDSLDVTWDDVDVTWDDTSTAELYSLNVSGNQQGFIEEYATSEVSNEESLSVSAVTLTAGPPTTVELTINNHNLETGDIIYLEGLLFFSAGVPASTDLNDAIYRVEVESETQVLLYKWNSSTQAWYSDFTFTPVTTATYMGGGTVALLPRFNCQTKDFNPFAPATSQMALSYVDFQTDVTNKIGEANTPAFTAELYVNSFMGQKANLMLSVANQQSETYLTSPYYMNVGAAQQYAWHRFYATAYGQYIRLGLTLDDELMNDMNVHESAWELNAICLWSRPGGIGPF
jgi:hypothetical protein